MLTKLVFVVDAAFEAFHRKYGIYLELASSLTTVKSKQKTSNATQVADQDCGRKVTSANAKS